MPRWVGHHRREGGVYDAGYSSQLVGARADGSNVLSIPESKTVVIKIGSSLIINDNKSIRERWLSDFAQDIKNLQKLKKNIIIVSSGAIALG